MTPEEKQRIEDLTDYFSKQIDGVRELIGERDRLYTDRFNAQEKAVLAAMASAKEAVTKAEAATEKRFEGVNELRGMANDILTKTMTRIEAEAAFKAVEAKLEAAIKSWDKRHQEIVDRTIALEKNNVAMGGEKLGAKGQVDNSRADLSLVVSAIVGVSLLLQFAWNALSPVFTKILLSK